jgi:hypothetical protein|tara:strand:- start:2144 stop:2320 length:177 start_codon:yes stop_codon:yes gene_type:complete
MIKRNLAHILILTSSVLGIIIIDYSKIEEPKQYWLLILDTIILIASIVLIVITERKKK